jgi:hypothetical protein
MATKSAQLRVLEDYVLLDEVFHFVGPKEWLFLGAVSKPWAALYLSRESETVPISQLRRKVTSYKAAAASLRRMLYALEIDRRFQLEARALGKAAASGGGREVLSWARGAAGERKWAQWHVQLCTAAAAGNQLATLKWLCAVAATHAQRITPDVAVKAAHCADLSTLHWICTQHGPHWSEEQVLRICSQL